jgi:5,10-methylenetetrahydromethanopterin reductase
MLVPRLGTPDHVLIAEGSGYDFAWIADSPTFMADPYMTLALAVAKTEHIRLGPAAITPRMRHVVANAGALATLCAMAPGRTEVVVGSGFTSQAMIGKKAVSWREVEEYVVALRALLRGQEISWEGATTGLTYSPLIGIRLPIEIPILIAAHGPKGYAVAERVGQGICTNPMHGSDNNLGKHAKVIVQVNGTVLQDNEDFKSQRVFETAGPAAAMQLHLGEGGAARGTEELAGYTAKLATVDESRRHMEVHKTHFVEVNDFEREFITPELIQRCTDTGTKQQWRARIKAFEDQGVTGVMIAAGGKNPDLEIAAFAECVKGA